MAGCRLIWPAFSVFIFCLWRNLKIGSFHPEIKIAGFPWAFGSVGKIGHYCHRKATNIVLPWMGPCQAPPLSTDPPLAHTTRSPCLPGTDLTEMAQQAAWAPVWGLEDQQCFYLVTLLTVGGGLWPTSRVTGPCPIGGFIIPGIIASLQAWHDGAGRARLLPYEPQPQTWS